MAGKSKTRVKSNQNLIPIASWEQADEWLCSIGDIQILIRECEDLAKTKIDIAKAELKKSTAPLITDIDTRVKSLEAFAAAHKDDFGKSKSRKLQFGVLGWRMSASIRVAKDTLTRIKEEFKVRAKDYIRVREEPDKDAMGKLTDEQLKSIGARREIKDVFYAEPDIPAAVDYEESRNA